MSKKTKVIPVIILVLSLIISQTACSKKTNQSTDPVQKSGFYLDTVCNLTIYDMKDMSEENASKVIEDAYKLCEKYENMLSALTIIMLTIAGSLNIESTIKSTNGIKAYP